METIINFINIFMDKIFSFPFVIFIIVLIFRKSIKKLMSRIKTVEVHGVKLSLSDRIKKDINKIVDRMEENLDYYKKQKIPEQNNNVKMKVNADKSYTDNNKDSNKYTVKNNYKNSDKPEIAIPRIYSTIETEAIKKFNISDSNNLPLTLLQKQKIDDDLFAALNSMKSLSDNINTFIISQKITKKDIANYEKSAKRIIEIIKKM
ncbi:MAG: hypothetical protein FWF68_05015 [Spirochaetes bacterium]|nr:hypothetical protein [Spirochaetota bacterium]